MSFNENVSDGEYEEFGQEYLYEENENVNVNVNEKRKSSIFSPSPVIVMSEKQRKSIGGDNGIVVLGRKSSGSVALERTVNLRKISTTSIPDQRKSSWASLTSPPPVPLKKIMNQEQKQLKTPVKEKKETTTCPTVRKNEKGKRKFKGTPMELDWGSSSIKVTTSPRKRKTRMCRYFQKYGKCNRNYCTFAHSEEELESSKAMNESYCVPEKINDPIEFSKSLEKTKICRNIARYGKCTRDVCTYAHSLDELRPKKCIFGDECKYIESKTRSCRYIHPCEDLAKYAERTGYKEPDGEHIYSPIELPIPMKKISTEVSPCKKENAKDTYARVAKCEEERQEIDCFEITMYGYKVPLELVNLRPIWTITCPKEFVEGIVGLAFSKGMKNIKINPI